MNRFLCRWAATIVADNDSRPIFELLEPFGIWSDRFNKEFWAPVGFQTDGCSVPQVAMSLTGYVAVRAGTIHDYYCHDDKGLAREDADLLFHDLLALCGVGPIKAQEMYDAVAGYTRQLRAQANAGKPDYLG